MGKSYLSTVTSAKEGDAKENAPKKLKEKKGFKVDRARHFEAKLKGKKNVKKESTSRPKEITFDDEGRKDYLLSLHKKKNERRVTAVIQKRTKEQRENSKWRQQRREEARKAYNEYAQVPILPDYSYKLPTVEDKDADEATTSKPARQTYLTTSTIDSSSVAVEVAPLFGADAHTSVKQAELPSAVKEYVDKLKKKKKGPATVKAKVNVVRELQKIRKIKKHCGKKKGKSGKSSGSKAKKRNR